MNPHKIVIKTSAEKDFDHIDAKTRDRIIKTIDNLKIASFPRGVRHIKGSDRKSFRIRVSKYRIIYSWDNLTRTVTIDHILLRDDQTYKRL